MTVTREKFSSQLDPALLEQARAFAKADGRQFQSVLEEALREYIERHSKPTVRRAVLEALAESLEEFDDLYRELAK